MKRLTKFQEAQLAYAYKHYSKTLDLWIALSASNGIRYYRNGFYGKVMDAFVRVGVAYKHDGKTLLIPEQAKAYIDKYACTDDELHLDRQSLTPFDKAQLRHLYEHNRLATYRTGGWGKGYAYNRLKETLMRLYHHDLISSAWFNSWVNLGADRLTDAGRAYVESHDISLSPLE